MLMEKIPDLDHKVPGHMNVHADGLAVELGDTEAARTGLGGDCLRKETKW